MKQVILRGWLLVCLLLQVTLVSAAVSVTPDRNPVGLGEEFELEFVATGGNPGNPDFSPLNQDFQVVGTSTSQNFSMVNGSFSQQVVWKVRLFANRTGKLSIPSLGFGTDRSPSIDIMVMDQVPGGSASNLVGKDDVMVELEPETATPYVQQQVVVVQRLLHAIPLQRNRASMTHPEIAGGKGVMQQLGGVKQYVTERKGRRYNVIERRYAVFPQASGELVLGKTIFEGVLDQGGPRSFDPFDFSGGGKLVRRLSDPLTLQVQPQPSSVGGSWLPARKLTLNAYWDRPLDQLKAGEPVTLTLAIIAEGLLAEQLPLLEVRVPDGIKSYANQPEFRNDANDSTMIGIRQEKWVLVPSGGGKFELPALELPWWNVASGSMEQAQLKAEQLVVTGEPLAPPAAAVPDPAAGTPQAQGAGQTPQPTGPALSVAADPVPLAGQGAMSWLLWVGAVFVLVVLAGLLRGLYRRHRSGAGTQRGSGYREAALVRLKKACQINDAVAAQGALRDWMREEPGLLPATMAHLRTRADPALRQALDQLNAALYAGEREPWRGAGLWQAIQAFRPQMPEHRPGSGSAARGLATLYPE
ncbi:MAG: protein BatD [Thiothrix sp.]|nr:protein BatD [Thiothrix sp.]